MNCYDDPSSGWHYAPRKTMEMDNCQKFESAITMDTGTSQHQLMTSGNHSNLRQYDYKVKLQYNFDRNLLNIHIPEPYEPEEGEIVEIFKIP